MERPLDTAIAPVPVPPKRMAPPPPPPRVSRYRGLRGGSVSSPPIKTFDVYCDGPRDEDEVAYGRLKRLSKSSSALSSKNAVSCLGAGALGPKPGPGGTTLGGAENSLHQLVGAAKPDADSVPFNLQLPMPHPAVAHLVPLPLNPKPPKARTTKPPAPPKIEVSLCDSQEDDSASTSTGTGNSIRNSTGSSATDATPPSPIESSAPPSPSLTSSPVPEAVTATATQDQPLDDERLAEEVARLEAETDRILAEQKKRDLVRLHAQLDATTPPKPRLFLDKLSFLTRTTPSDADSQPGTPTKSPKSPLPPKSFRLPWSPSSISFLGSPGADKMAFIEQGGGGVVPGIDAPTSASNGGERRVTVRCLSSTINLPVTPDTTPVDIAYSTANFITHTINPANTIVVECYDVLGLERRVRRYERIRDVMNSWDRDQLNSLMVLCEDDLEEHRDLDAAAVSRTEEAPTGFCYQLYHCSKPGKWNKRWITLMDNGQIFAAKRPDSKPTDKDSVMLCHLSDFDIYTPGESQMKRHIRPPKKYCYGVKSQQKANFFANQDNFLHYFCTEDRDLANRLYELIHGWRSWYLAHKQIGIFKPKEEEPPLRPRTKTNESLKKSMSIARRNTQRSPRLSLEKTPYTIGEFAPLLDMSDFDKPLEEFGKNIPAPQPAAAPAPPAQKSKDVPRPPVSLIKQKTAGPGGDPDQFLAGGLLGHAYDQRKLQEQAAQASKADDGPFTGGSSLLNNVPAPTTTANEPEASPWLPSALEHTARARTTQQPRMPMPRRPATADASRHHHQQQHHQQHQHHHQQQQPLVNLKDDFPIPPLPQGGNRLHRSGTGRAVKPPNGAPLVDYAGGISNNSAPMPSRNIARMSSSATGGRPRSRSSGNPRQNGQTLIQFDRPPVPALPDRSSRRPGVRVVSNPSRGRDPRAQEPLINRIK
ncbi:unnamed protein product [Clonostachys chloroleuca]|uniref:Ras-associating domain-containing protein n=1 Tax=Clonostachys chloroleuca TaxID=1926264 RepID=A0AA35MHU3_9HYPO|nr:unnamed protein product [Clonostachys chloroleuca]